jgi:DNA-binding CsgD family transcriptional regulator
MGKTRLYDAAVGAARERGMRVLRAGGAELERTIAFGIASQLLEAQLNELAAARREAILAEAPAVVRSLTSGAEHAGHGATEGDLALSHWLFTLIATVDEKRPALIAIDDLHWCDAASLEFVLYLLHRLEELPIGLLLTRRIVSGVDVSEVLDRIATHPRIGIESLSPLGAVAVSELVDEALGDRATQALGEACLVATGGNPFYLHELLSALGQERQLGAAELLERARALAPDAVTRSIRVRIGRLGAAAAGIASALAILGDDVELRNAAALAGLPLDDAAAAADALGAVEIILPREPLRFVHPLVRQAVLRDIPPFELASRHLEAARLLYADGAGAERVAAHLLRGRAQGDRWVVERLRSAAREAQGRAAPQSEASYLQRALEEPPAEELRAEVLAELGVAEAAAGAPRAAEHLAAATVAVSDRRRRAELALELGRVLDTQGLHERAARTYEQGLRELALEPPEEDELELYDQLHTGVLAAGTLVPDLQEEVLERSAELIRNAPEVPRSQGQRLLLAQAALQAAFGGRAASVVRDFAERAWDRGRLLRFAASQWVGWRIVSASFLLAGELERAAEVAEAAMKDARRRGWPLAFATASFMRGLPQLWRGRVDEAIADLEAARDARRYGWHQFTRAAAAHYALCLIERGELDEAESALREERGGEAPEDLEDVLCRFSLAELRLAQGRPEQALRLARESGEVAERTVTFFGYCPWRTTAAQAALALGEREQALRLAREAAARAEQLEVLHQRIRTLRVLGLCQAREEGIATLRTAVQLGLSGPPRLEAIHALVDLGAALRRGNQRADSREPLQHAADMAQRGGARALHERALTELAASGARPRRDAFLSGLGSLTPSERRIADHAAAGQSNREIAQALFVTPKTVEYHLRNVYRKLEIQTRRELSEALTG